MKGKFVLSVLWGSLFVSQSTAWSLELHMQRGWNLIGVPCQVNATTFLTPSMRNKIVVVWKANLDGDNVRWQAVSPNPQTQQWLINHGYPSFNHINPYEGFWLYANQPFTLRICSKIYSNNTIDW